MDLTLLGLGIAAGMILAGIVFDRVASVICLDWDVSENQNIKVQHMCDLLKRDSVRKNAEAESQIN